MSSHWDDDYDSDDTSDDDGPTARANAVLDKHRDLLMAKAHVQGVAIGWIQDDDDDEGHIGIVVMVDQKVPKRLLQPHDVVPEKLDGVTVEVREMGIFSAQ
jgi:hypothetical protein